jgi:hypothetical protein
MAKDWSESFGVSVIMTLILGVICGGAYLMTLVPEWAIALGALAVVLLLFAK